jgi:ribosomal protein S18 acetylase RimI-like enzyme
LQLFHPSFWWHRFRKCKNFFVALYVFKMGHFYLVESLLHNPVYHALLSGESHWAEGDEYVKYFPTDVSPFAGFGSERTDGFERLHALLPLGRSILFARPEPLEEIPAGWQVRHHIPGTQFIHHGQVASANFDALQPLGKPHIEEMIALTRLTRPGPFGSRTIEFGGYHGIFENGRLAAMTGQRLHVGNYTEVSAVCTHPDDWGKGYATLLLLHQLHLILKQGKQPFLHVRADNERAIGVYQRLGFVASRPMHFYFMVRV